MPETPVVHLVLALANASSEASSGFVSGFNLLSGDLDSFRMRSRSATALATISSSNLPEHKSLSCDFSDALSFSSFSIRSLIAAFSISNSVSLCFERAACTPRPPRLPRPMLRRLCGGPRLRESTEPLREEEATAREPSDLADSGAGE